MAARITTSLRSPLRPALDEPAFYGLAGDVVRTLEPNTEADPAALLLHFLVMFGNACGPGPSTWTAGDQPARLFAMIVGDTADARKGTASAALEDLFERVPREWGKLTIKRGVSSAEGLIRMVDDQGTTKRVLLIESEFERLLATMARSGGGLTGALKDAFDGRDLEVNVRDTRRVLKATRPFVSVIGHVQPRVLSDKLGDLEVVSGFANRFLYGVVHRRGLLPDVAETIDEDGLNKLAARIGEAIESAWRLTLEDLDPISQFLHVHFDTQPGFRLDRTDAFKIRWRELYGEGDRPGPLNEHAPGALGAIISRAPTHVLRLAVTYALADQARALDAQHLEAAYAVWRYCRASVEAVFGTLTGIRDVDQVLRELGRSTNHRMTRMEMSTLFNRHRTKRQLDEITDQLLDTGYVSHRRASTSGRSVDIYILTELGKRALRIGEESEDAPEGMVA